MLSYISRIVCRFEHSHELSPNTLYLNQRHFERLKNEFADPDDVDAISSFFGMRLIFSHDALHPHVAYHNPRRHKASLQNNTHQAANSQQSAYMAG